MLIGKGPLCLGPAESAGDRRSAPRTAQRNQKTRKESHGVNSHEDTRTQPDELQRLLNEANLKHQTFRDQVRARIIKAHKDGDICLDGMNGGLRELGLDEYKPSWRGTVTIAVEVRVSGTDDVYTAREWARSAVRVSSVDDDVRIDDFDASAHDFTEADEENS